MLQVPTNLEIDLAVQERIALKMLLALFEGALVHFRDRDDEFWHAQRSSWERYMTSWATDARFRAGWKACLSADSSQEFVAYVQSLIDRSAGLSDAEPRQLRGVDPLLDTATELLAITPSRLRAIPALEALEDDALTELCQLFVTERVPSGREIVRDGDEAEHFYIVVHGVLEVIRASNDSADRRVAVLQDGDHFGEIALIHDIPRTATVRSLTPSVLISLHRDQFRRLLALQPAWKDRLMRASEMRTPAREWSTSIEPSR